MCSSQEGDELTTRSVVLMSFPTFEKLQTKFNKEKFNKLNQTMSFPEYLEMALNRPNLSFSAYQRLYSMIVSAGSHTYEKYRKTHTRYHFFDDPSIPVFGLDETLESLVKHTRGAAHFHGPERRILLLHGPVGSAKSTICRRIKRGLESFSETDDGAVYSYDWVGLEKIGLDIKDQVACPLNDDPLKLLLPEMRKDILGDLQKRLYQISPEKERNNLFPIKIVGDLNPKCNFYMKELLKRYDGDWSKVVTNHIQVRRVVLSEANRCGIGTFQPKDPKNQDATELTGDVDYLKLGTYGVDSDPRAFSFDGEFQIANRGMLEFIEVLKLEKEFLYDLLGVCQERQIKPKKFPQMDVDMILISHSNNPEFERMKNDNTMEALRDRTVRVDCPYLTELSKETSVLKQDFNKEKVGRHIAPHTIEVVALWLILTRLSDKDAEVSLVDKAKLYDGKSMPNWTEERVKELKDKMEKYQEGLKRGISARFAQNAISNCLVGENSYIGPFVVLNEIKEKLKLLISSDKENAAHAEACLAHVEAELDEILKEEVQKAIVGDEDVLERVFSNYIDNVVAFCNKEKIVNKVTGKDMDPDERMMRSIEEKAEVPDALAADYREQIQQFMFSHQRKGKTIKWDSNPRLATAIRKKVFEEMKDHIKISQFTSVANVTNKELQSKIDAIRQRMIDNYGYTDESAQDVLMHVSSIFARGTTADQ